MSDIDPADITPGPRRTPPDTFDPDLVDAPAITPHKKPEREGLPPGYRMRADTHYVDQLTSRKVEKPAGDAPRPDHRESEAARIEHLLAQVTEGLATIGSAAALLSTETSSIGRRVNLDLIKTQTWRASWLLRAHTILHGARKMRIRPRPLAFLLNEVRNGFAAECRLAGISLEVHASDWNAVVVVDDENLIAGIAGAVFSTVALVEEAEGVTIRVRAVASAGELRTVDVGQDTVMVPAAASSWFFEPALVDRPGVWATALGATIARAVAQQHGGDAALLVGDRGDSTVRLSFSRANEPTGHMKGS